MTFESDMDNVINLGKIIFYYPLCNKEYKTEDGLKKHLMYHHGMLQQCSISEIYELLKKGKNK